MSFVDIMYNNHIIFPLFMVPFSPFIGERFLMGPYFVFPPFSPSDIMANPPQVKCKSEITPSSVKKKRAPSKGTEDSKDIPK
jgi:hypothetical protein